MSNMILKYQERQYTGQTETLECRYFKVELICMCKYIHHTQVNINIQYMFNPLALNRKDHIVSELILCSYIQMPPIRKRNMNQVKSGRVIFMPTILRLMFKKCAG